ncbi:MAG: hypothetical protein RL660_1631 [Bacteroidota bacterium]|jgi:hypothetical protein
MAKVKVAEEMVKSVGPEVKDLPQATIDANQPVQHDGTFMFEKQNYIYMGAGLVLIILGYILMAGGKSPDPNVFNYDEIYSFRRITLAPILVVAGYLVEIFAILWTPKK